MEIGKFKAREVQPTVLRLHPELREELIRIAAINGRSLTKEISDRLQNSLPAYGATLQGILSREKNGQEPGIAPGAAYPISVATAHHANDGKENDPQHDIRNNNEKSLVNTLSGIDQAMLDVFRKLPPEKQLALLSLFK